MPENTVYVGRPTKYGNPFKVDDYENGQRLPRERLQQLAVDDYRRRLAQGQLPYTPADIRRELAGKDLACWCREGTPCHADVLLEIANSCE